MLLNFSWSPVFFTLHNMALGLVIILAMLASISGFISVQVQDNRTAAILFVPRGLGRFRGNPQLRAVDAQLTSGLILMFFTTPTTVSAD